jgi:hypothetical protein
MPIVSLLLLVNAALSHSTSDGSRVLSGAAVESRFRKPFPIVVTPLGEAAGVERRVAGGP